jgi:hypothetical protein
LYFVKTRFLSAALFFSLFIFFQTEIHADGSRAAPERTDRFRQLKNGLYIDALSPLLGISNGGFGLGLGYERAVTPLLGLSGAGVWAFAPLSQFGLKGGLHIAALEGAVRLYPLYSSTRGLFLGIRAGGFIITGTGYKADERLGSLSAIPTASAEIGWKFLAGSKKSALILEPFVRYIVLLPGTISALYGSRSSSFSTNAVFGMLITGVSIGIAF